MNAYSPVHRFTSRKRVVATLGVAAMALTSVAVGISAAQAADDAPNGTFSAWSQKSFTDWQTDKTPPADPDGVDAPDNPSNLLMIGAGGPGASPEVYVRTVTTVPKTENSGWVTSERGDGWVKVDQKTETDVASSNEVVEAAHWQRYSWKGGPIDEGITPTWTGPTDPNWQANVKDDPHDIGHAGAYDQGKPGNADWFYLELVPAKVVHHDAQTHEEYMYERTTPGTETVQYRWSVYARTFTPASETVVDEHPAGVEQPAGVEEPAGDEQPAGVEEPKTEPAVAPSKGSTVEPAVATTVAGPKNATQPQDKSAQPQAVPTSIDAGL